MATEQTIGDLETELGTVQGEIEAMQDCVRALQEHETRIWHALRLLMNKGTGK